MGKNETRFRYALLTFAAVAALTFMVELFLMLLKPEIILFFCPWIVCQSENSALILITVACLFGLLGGAVAFLRRTLADMETHYNHAINELRTRLQTLEEKLDTKEKD